MSTNKQEEENMDDYKSLFILIQQCKAWEEDEDADYDEHSYFILGYFTSKEKMFEMINNMLENGSDYDRENLVDERCYYIEVALDYLDSCGSPLSDLDRGIDIDIQQINPEIYTKYKTPFEEKRINFLKNEIKELEIKLGRYNKND